MTTYISNLTRFKIKT